VQLTELRRGLCRWTARHPAWRAGARPGSPDDWPPDVGCVAYEADDALAVVDPLVPAGREEAFWAEMDALAGRGRVCVLTTIRWHRRSRDAFVARYGASTSRARATLPAAVETRPIRGAGETMVWLPEHAALVPGDRLLGADGGGLEICPESWLRYLESGITRVELAEALRPLLELPIEMVLVSHGPPVLRRGHEAVARALDDAAGA
jgi:hypothetical protein